MATLTTKYLGLTRRNPIVVSACPLTGELDVLRRLEDYGAGAAVLPSLFEEQVDHDPAEVRQLAGPRRGTVHRERGVLSRAQGI